MLSGAKDLTRRAKTLHYTQHDSAPPDYRALAKRVCSRLSSWLPPPLVILSEAKDLARWAEMLHGVYPECNEWAQHEKRLRPIPAAFWPTRALESMPLLVTGPPSFD